ncbi:MAG: RHS repeat protein, partial [Gammaproteobacteria bacterium]|nr:RHS repeat protein [Gammaproteobacteria bacterium]
HLPGNIHSKCSHDPTGKLLTQAIYTSTDKEPHLLAGRKYTWDKRGKLISLQDETRGTKRFTYDPAGQVTDVSHCQKPAEQYEFDSCGNIAEGTCARGNRQEKLNGRQYRYDTRGNATFVSGNNTTCERRFNVFNQLISIHGPDGPHVEFLYDAFGRRILKKTPDKQTHYYWDQYRLAGEETDQSRTGYIYYPNTFVPLCCMKDGVSYFYQTDHLGTPMEITNDRGDLVWFGHYDTFGTCHVDENSTFENNLRFQGQYHDKETGLL